MTKDEALKLALEALEEQIRMANGWQSPAEAKAIDAIKEALAQPEQEYHAVNAVHKGQQCYVKTKPKEPEQEPVAWMFTDAEGTEFFEQREDWEGKWTPLYTTPPQRKPLTYEEIDELSRTMVKGNKSVNWLCRAIEAAHGIKGEA